MKRVLFLCTGNYYRSRFAEVLFNWHTQRQGLPWRAESRGLALDSRNPGPVSPHTVSWLATRGICCEDGPRFPQSVAEADFVSAHHVVAVKNAEHRPLIEANFPTWLESVEFWHVHDLDCATPDEALPHLEKEVLGLIDRLAASEG